MPSWERLQNPQSSSISTPFEDDDDDFLMNCDNESGVGLGQPNNTSPTATLTRAINNLNLSRKSFGFWIGFATTLFLLGLCIILISTSHHNSNDPTSGGANAPFIEPFDDSTPSDPKTGPPSELTPGLQYLYDIFQLVTSNVSTSGAATTGPVPIVVAYETGSRSSRIFLSHQFFPTYFKLASYIRPVLVPYGRSSITSDPATGVETLICDHGPEECRGNLIHACALRYTLWNDSLSVTRVMMFLECLVDADSRTDRPTGGGPTALNCAKNSGLYWPPVQKCAEDGEGLRLMHTMRNLTDTYVGSGAEKSVEFPVVLFNGHKEEGPDQFSIQGNFLKFLCHKFLNGTTTSRTRIRECQQQS